MHTTIDPRLCETYTAPTNIAVIKYWGKGNIKLNTPMNSSASVTLDQSDLHTITTICANKSFSSDRLWLNGKEIEINGRGKTCIQEIRKLARDRFDIATGEVLVRKEDWSLYGLHICSINTFPTGAGLASSAAGLACFVAALAKLFCVEEEYVGQLTAIARQGSGSASRSMYGGFVKWEKGIKEDGTDSIAIQIADENHWPEMSAIVLVVSDKEKDTSSTSGMETSRMTSLLLQHRANMIVPTRLHEMEQAIHSKDFETFGKLTMQDSNQFHAVCLDTYPPIFYMNDISKAIIRLVHVINDHYGYLKTAYTFDAGPNAVLYTLEENVPLITAIVVKFFPFASSDVGSYTNNPSKLQSFVNDSAAMIPSELITKLNHIGRIQQENDIKYIFLTKVGAGPIHQPIEESIIDLSNGLPLNEPGPKHKRMKL